MADTVVPSVKQEPLPQRENSNANQSTSAAPDNNTNNNNRPQNGQQNQGQNKNRRGNFRGGRGGGPGGPMNRSFANRGQGPQNNNRGFNNKQQNPPMKQNDVSENFSFFKMADRLPKSDAVI